jgi:hypothetical protein
MKHEEERYRDAIRRTHFAFGLGTGPPLGKYANFDTPESSGFPGMIKVVLSEEFWFFPKFATMQLVCHTSTDFFVASFLKAFKSCGFGTFCISLGFNNSLINE